MTGNKERQSIIGLDLILLAVFYSIWPCGDADEACIFIFNNGGDVYTRNDVSKRMKDIQMTRKVASTEAYQAFLPNNLLRLYLFFTGPPPVGLVGVPRRKCIDFDEFAITLEKCNSKQGFALEGHRIRKSGHYTKSAKLSVILAAEPGDPRLPPAIYGSIQRPRRWICCLQARNTSALIFANFVEHVCTDIETNGIPAVVQDTDTHRVLTWDNFTAHHSHLVAQAYGIRNGNSHFTAIARPPYQPKFGPIEYIICQVLACASKKIDAESTAPQLDNAVREATLEVGMDGSFDRTFAHCQYPA